MLRVPEDVSVGFKAGQYLEMILPDRKCPFSIASAPSTNGLLELHVKPTPNSDDSIKIEEFLDSTEYMDIEIPKGECFLTEKPGGALLLLAASTGITQMKSIMEQILPAGLTDPVILYWGVVTDRDLYLNELIESWAAKHDNFHYHPVVSEPETSPGWTGKTGLVGEVALQDLDDVSNITVYVSGGPGMVYATLDMFRNAGMPSGNMHSDVFSYAPRKS